MRENAPVSWELSRISFIFDWNTHYKSPTLHFAENIAHFWKKHQWTDSWLPPIFAMSKDKKNMSLLKVIKARNFSSLYNRSFCKTKKSIVKEQNKSKQ